MISTFEKATLQVSAVSGTYDAIFESQLALCTYMHNFTLAHGMCLRSAELNAWKAIIV